MFEPAAESAVLELECVFAIRRPAEQCERLVHHPLNPGDECDRVERRRVGQRPVHDAMRHAAFLEAPLPQTADQNGGVYECPRTQRHEHVTIGCRAEPRGDCPAVRQVEHHRNRRVLATEQIHERVRTADQSAGRCKKGPPRRAQTWFRGRKCDAIVHGHGAARSHDLPHCAVYASDRTAVDCEVTHVAPVAIVVLGMRGHREADGIGRRPEPDLDGPSREIRAVDAERVLDRGFQRRMSRREEGENKGE